MNVTSEFYASNVVAISSLLNNFHQLLLVHKNTYFSSTVKICLTSETSQVNLVLLLPIKDFLCLLLFSQNSEKNDKQMAQN